MLRLVAALVLATTASAVENALHDSRAALGDATPCCEYCDPSKYPCPPSMAGGPSPRTLSWEEFMRGAGAGPLTIPCGTRVEVSTGGAIAAPGLRVEGELAFLDGAADVSLTTPYVYVCGVLAAGTLGQPFTAKLDVTLSGPEKLVADGIDYGAEAFAVHGGLVFLRGGACSDARTFSSRRAVEEGSAQRTTWTRLVKQALPGDREIRVRGAQEVIKPGGEIAIASTDWDDALTETARVASRRADGVLTLDRPLKYAHGGSGDVAAEVVSLTRNIVIRGAPGCADRAPKPRCGHFLVSHTPHGIVCGVEFTNLGAHTTLGKYPLHAHMCGNASALAFAANAIHTTYQRSLVVHSTSDALFAHNVAYDGVGHMYVFENGLELRNAVVENVGMVTWPPEPAWSCPGRKCASSGVAGEGQCSFGVGDNIEACGSRDDEHAEIFWLANPENDLLRNVAVGGYRSSFSFYPVMAGPLVGDYEAQLRAGLDPKLVEWLRVSDQYNKVAPRVKEAAVERVFATRPDFFHMSSSDPLQLSSNYHSSGARHLALAHPGRFEGNVAHSTRIGFHVYPRWAPAALRGATDRTALWKDLVAYKIGGSAIRAKTRCEAHGCLEITGFRATMTPMVARARDVHARFAIRDLAYAGPEAADDAGAAGACLEPAAACRDAVVECPTSTKREVGRCPDVRQNCENSKRYKNSCNQRIVSVKRSSPRGPVITHCETCSGRLISLAPGERGMFSTHKGHHAAARSCRLPYLDVNYDRASIEKDLAEKCAMRKGGGASAENLRSCYLTGGNLSDSIAVDAASVASLDAYRAAHRGGTCAHEKLVRGQYTVRG